MLEIYLETQYDKCYQLWRAHIPETSFWNSWDVRLCFHQHYQHKMVFVVARDHEDILGLIPLSYIQDHQYYGYFPGETWQGKTWLEQNHCYAKTTDIFEKMLDWVHQQGRNFHIRYMVAQADFVCDASEVDEIGYIFYPPAYQFSMDNYFKEFSGKSIKRLNREIQSFYDRGITFRTGHLADFDVMVKMNLERFGQDSYFADQRFLNSMTALKDYLASHNMLHMVSILMDGDPIAVDISSVYNNIYTVYAGGTHAGFPGVAKVINMHHLRYACEQQFDQVDFLCGDFTWKKQFHLTPRPLYQLKSFQGELSRV